MRVWMTYSGKYSHDVTTVDQTLLGFAQLFQSYIEQLAPDRVAVVFDGRQCRRSRDELVDRAHGDAAGVLHSAHEAEVAGFSLPTTYIE